MPTITKLTPALFREELEELLQLATQYAVLEDRLERKAAEIEASDWQFADDAPSLLAAVDGQVGRALGAVTGLEDFNGTALDLCQRIQDAIDVLTFAIERDDDAR